MMVRIASWLAVTIILGTALAGCTADSERIVADLGEEFVLPIKQEAAIAGEDLIIGFENVVEDSRCPVDVVCIWEGRAGMVLAVNYNGHPYQIVLNEPGLTDRVEDAFLGYRLSFHLEPYPGQAREISEDDYRLRMVIDK